jgi:hypothetical protein
MSRVTKTVFRNTVYPEVVWLVGMRIRALKAPKGFCNISLSESDVQVMTYTYDKEE